MNIGRDCVIVDSGGANLASVQLALQRLGVDAPLVRTADALANAGRVLLPGVGAAGPVMRRLAELGLVAALQDLRKPLLGICVGMQVLFESSEEGDVQGLGLLPGRVQRLQPSEGARVPHMGWNRLRHQRSPSPLLDGIEDGGQAYFVHSYAAPVSSACISACTHGDAFAAVVQHDWVAGAQFHPERSAALGARLLQNFLRWEIT